MAVNPVLYIALGLSIGVGATLIVLQERFVRERRKLLAELESEKIKAQQQLTELDAKWDEETKGADKERLSLQGKVAQWEQEQGMWEIERKRFMEQLADLQSGGDLEEDKVRVESCLKQLQGKEEECAELEKERDAILTSYHEAREEVSELHNEIEILKGSIRSLEEIKKKTSQDDDFFIQSPGDHIIPGTVARALMGKK